MLLIATCASSIHEAWQHDDMTCVYGTATTDGARLTSLLSSLPFWLKHDAGGLLSYLVTLGWATGRHPRQKGSASSSKSNCEHVIPKKPTPLKTSHRRANHCSDERETTAVIQESGVTALMPQADATQGKRCSYHEHVCHV